MTALQPVIRSRILALRKQRVMLDADLAQLCGVATRVLVQMVKRNLMRFPGDFTPQLSADEFANLRSQVCDLKCWPRQSAHSAYAFNEQGVAPDPPKRPIGFINPEDKGKKTSRARLKT